MPGCLLHGVPAYASNGHTSYPCHWYIHADIYVSFTAQASLLQASCDDRGPLVIADRGRRNTQPQQPRQKRSAALSSVTFTAGARHASFSSRQSGLACTCTPAKPWLWAQAFLHRPYGMACIGEPRAATGGSCTHDVPVPSAVNRHERGSGLSTNEPGPNVPLNAVLCWVCPVIGLRSCGLPQPSGSSGSLSLSHPMLPHITQYHTVCYTEKVKRPGTVKEGKHYNKRSRLSEVSMSLWIWLCNHTYTL